MTAHATVDLPELCSHVASTHIRSVFNHFHILSSFYRPFFSLRLPVSLLLIFIPTLSGRWPLGQSEVPPPFAIPVPNIFTSALLFMYVLELSLHEHTPHPHHAHRFNSPPQTHTLFLHTLLPRLQHRLVISRKMPSPEVL